MTPHDVEAMAMALGIRRPLYSKVDRPEVWQGWSDSVALAWNRWHCGGDPRPIIRDAEVLGGHQPIERHAIPGQLPGTLQAFLDRLVRLDA